MLSYEITAAIELLRSKLKSAQENLENLVTDLEYLKEQVTIMEVNMARVYNWDVKTRREARLKGEDKGENLGWEATNWESRIAAYPEARKCVQVVGNFIVYSFGILIRVWHGRECRYSCQC